MNINVVEFTHHCAIIRRYCPPALLNYYLQFTMHHARGFYDFEYWLSHTIFIFKDYPLVVLALNHVLYPVVRIGIDNGFYFRVMVAENHIWYYFVEGEARRRWLGRIF